MTGKKPVPKALPLGGRPTEALSGLGLAAAVYGFLTQAGVPAAVAGIVGVVVAFAPVGISTAVDAIYRDRR